jgi:crossover junction endodeoxyribonuclease RuvC
VKQEKIILGIDPGTNVMGYGLIKTLGQKVKILQLDVKHFSKYKNHHTKLKYLFECTLQLVENHVPDELAVEAPFFGKNVQSMLKLGRAQGVIMAAAMYRDIPVTEYSPRKIKQSITGTGAASKEQVALMMEKIFQQRLTTQFLDATDGLAVALCHHYQSGNPRGNNSPKSWDDFIKKNPGKISGNKK